LRQPTSTCLVNLHQTEGSMDFHELLQNVKFKAAVGPEKLALYSGPDGIHAMWEDFERESENVLTVFAAHASWIDFNRWHGFFVWQWTDTSEEGASDALENIFGSYPFENWSACDGEIRSEKLPLETLKKIALKLLPEEDDQIRINGSLVKRQGSELVEVTA
jgi:hypothetical protein